MQVDPVVNKRHRIEQRDQSRIERFNLIGHNYISEPVEAPAVPYFFALPDDLFKALLEYPDIICKRDIDQKTAANLQGTVNRETGTGVKRIDSYMLKHLIRSGAPQCTPHKTFHFLSAHES